MHFCRQEREAFEFVLRCDTTRWRTFKFKRRLSIALGAMHREGYGVTQMETKAQVIERMKQVYEQYEIESACETLLNMRRGKRSGPVRRAMEPVERMQRALERWETCRALVQLQQRAEWDIDSILEYLESLPS